MCEIEISHMGKNNRYPYLVCEKVVLSNVFLIYARGPGVQLVAHLIADPHR